LEGGLAAPRYLAVLSMRSISTRARPAFPVVKTFGEDSLILKALAAVKSQKCEGRSETAITSLLVALSRKVAHT
jgi:hypothetical protein